MSILSVEAYVCYLFIHFYTNTHKDTRHEQSAHFALSSCAIKLMLELNIVTSNFCCCEWIQLLLLLYLSLQFLDGIQSMFLECAQHHSILCTSNLYEARDLCRELNKKKINKLIRYSLYTFDCISN